jgi:hypothetical protein
MGMGTAPCYGWHISLANLKEICPQEVAIVEALFPVLDTSWGEIACTLQSEDELSDAIGLALDELYNAFEKATELRLGIDYYDEEGGDRYDSVEHIDGCAFVVEGVTQFTQAGERWKDKLSEDMWTMFG